MAQVTQYRPVVTVVDAPSGFDLTRVAKALRKLDYQTFDFKILCSHYGDATARRRHVLVAGKGGAATGLASIQMPPARRCPHGVKHF